MILSVVFYNFALKNNQLEICANSVPNSWIIISRATKSLRAENKKTGKSLERPQLLGSFAVKNSIQ